MVKNAGDLASGNCSFRDCGAVYLFTNENIYGTLKTVGDISDRRVLTVGASGDHAFEAYLAGAGIVDTFDINLNQKNIIELKSCMIKKLPYGQFMDFFFSSDNFFNQKILTPIQSSFSDDVRKFLARCADGNILDRFRYRAAYTKEYNIKNLQYISNKENYSLLRDRLPETIRFIHSDISSLKNKLNPKYDLMLLSNIVTYLYPNSCDFEEKLLCTYKDILVPLVLDGVTNGGRVYFYYDWGVNSAAWANFMDYFQAKYRPDMSMVARVVSPAYCKSINDIVLYATKKQKTL